ncbi:UDP-glucose 4-epimerase GalE [Novispirillum sp. DQ9]|uniref:UDP-glucose 4-epimerase GalE n=1 Tax=Novispirillum sp. DQ9 TaxID=3398612 RepID=UPI003C7D5359
MSNGKATILVVGGAGYIGSHACKALAAEGFIPVVFDNFHRGHRWAVQWGPLVEGDIRDAAALDAAFAAHRPVAVMHFAALSEVGESVKRPYDFYSNNVCGTLSLLQAMERAGCATIVFSSTCATYGLPETVPIPEDHPQRPINPYGATKLAVEGLLRDAGPALGLRSAVLRYFNAAGADPEAQVGERHEPETHLIPLVLQVAAGRRDCIRVFGDDYPTPDGTCIRDYIHVCDLADAHVLALRHLLAGGDSLELNLGNGAGYSVREVIDTARAVTGHAIPAITEPRRPGDPPVLVGDAAKARALLGWVPRRPALADQIADAWRWECTGAPA